MRKQTLALVALFICLCAAAAAVLRQRPERGMVRLDLTHTDLTRVDSITTARDNQEVALHREGSAWLLANGHRCDPDLVTNLLASVGAVNSSDFITADTGRFQDLQVEGAHAMRLRLAVGSRTVTDLLVGEGQAPGTSYVRQGDRVFRAQGSPLSSLHRDAASWEDRRVYAEGADDFDALRVHVGGAVSLDLRHVDGVWAAAADAPVPTAMRFDASQAQSLAQQLGNLRAARLVDVDPGDDVTQLGRADADSVTWQLTQAAAARLGRAEGKLTMGALLPEGEGEDAAGERYVRAAGSPQLYAVLERDLQGLRRGWDGMRTLTVMAPVDYDSIREVTFKRAGQPAYGFARGADALWTPTRASRLGRNFEVDAVKLRQRVQQALLARAVSVRTASAKAYAIGAPQGEQVTLVDDGGTAHVLSYGRAMRGDEGHGYWAQGSADKLVYGISRALHDGMLGDAQSLRKVAAKASAGPTGFSGAEGITPEMEAQIRRQLAASNPG